MPGVRRGLAARRTRPGGLCATRTGHACRWSRRVSQLRRAGRSAIGSLRFGRRDPARQPGGAPRRLVCRPQRWVASSRRRRFQTWVWGHGLSAGVTTRWLLPRLDSGQARQASAQGHGLGPASWKRPGAAVALDADRQGRAPATPHRPLLHRRTSDGGLVSAVLERQGHRLAAGCRRHGHHRPVRHAGARARPLDLSARSLPVQQHGGMGDLAEWGAARLVPNRTLGLRLARRLPLPQTDRVAGRHTHRVRIPLRQQRREPCEPVRSAAARAPRRSLHRRDGQSHLAVGDGGSRCATSKSSATTASCCCSWRC